MESVGSSEAETHLPHPLEQVARLIPDTLAKPKLDVRATIEAMKELRKGQMLGGLSVREMIEEGRRF